MKLVEWLKRNGITPYRFAKDNGIPHTTMTSIRKGVIPRPELMLKIVLATRGEVRPDDFYDLDLSALDHLPPPPVPLLGADMMRAMAEPKQSGFMHQEDLLKATKAKTRGRPKAKK